ncbi:hypothetical protein RSAG8_08245, partial [Rhizoctonia solani AG-8 WAC10335]
MRISRFPRRSRFVWPCEVFDRFARVVLLQNSRQAILLMRNMEGSELASFVLSAELDRLRFRRLALPVWVIT